MSEKKENTTRSTKGIGAQIKEKADQAIDSLKSVMSSSEESPSDKRTIKVRFTKGPSAKFLLPYNVGQEKEIPETQAKELIENGYAEKV